MSNYYSLDIASYTRSSGCFSRSATGTGTVAVKCTFCSFIAADNGGRKGQTACNEKVTESLKIDLRLGWRTALSLDAFENKVTESASAHSYYFSKHFQKTV